MEEYVTNSNGSLLGAKAMAGIVVSTDEHELNPEEAAMFLNAPSWNVGVTATLTNALATNSVLKVTLVLTRKLRTYSGAGIAWSEPGYTDATGHMGEGVSYINPRQPWHVDTGNLLCESKSRAYIVGTDSESFFSVGRSEVDPDPDAGLVVTGTKTVTILLTTTNGTNFSGNGTFDSDSLGAYAIASYQEMGPSMSFGMGTAVAQSQYVLAKLYSRQAP